MYPVSAAFLEAIAGSHTAVVRAECYLGDALLAEIPITGGSVSVDARRGALRTCALTVSPDNTQSLDDLYAALGRYGAELRLYRGVAMQDSAVVTSNAIASRAALRARAFSGWIGGASAALRAFAGWGPVGATAAERSVTIPPLTEYLVPIGVFVITDADYSKTASTLTVNGTDRSLRITRARFEDPYWIAPLTDLAEGISDLLTDRWPDCPVGFTAADVGGARIGSQVVLEGGESSDPWKDARSIVEACGFDLYFDGAGTAQIRNVPDVASTPASVTYGNGDAAVVIDSNRRMTFEQTYTGVIVGGEGTGVEVPVRGEAWDDDPTSPTYYLGPVGRIPYFYSSPLITTQDAADNAAGSILARVVGRTEQVAWSQIVNPAHDALDVVGLTDDDGSVHRYVLDALTIPLSVTDSMGATARETRTVA